MHGFTQLALTVSNFLGRWLSKDTVLLKNVWCFR